MGHVLASRRLAQGEIWIGRNRLNRTSEPKFTVASVVFRQSSAVIRLASTQVLVKLKGQLFEVSRGGRRRPKGKWLRSHSYYLPSRDKGIAVDGINFYGAMMDDADTTCMFVDESGSICKKPSPNRCHLIPESAILKPLANSRSGKVMELRWTLSGWKHLLQERDESNPVVILDPETYDPERTPLEVGTGFATVGHFACKPHDGVFQRIDVPQPDSCDLEAMFLTAYRALLFVGSLVRSILKVLNDEDTDRRVMRLGSPKIRNQWENLKANPALKKVLPAIAEYGRMWNERDSSRLSAVQATPFSFRSQLRFAASGILGDVGQVIGVYPGQDDLHTLLVIQIGDEKGNARDEREHLEATAQTTLKADNPRVALVCDLVKHMAGSIAASPDSYKRLSHTERQGIQVAIRHSSKASDIDAMLSQRPGRPPRTS